MKKAILLAAVAAGALSCAKPGSLSGEINLRWAFDNAGSCTDADVALIDVVVVRADTGTEEFSGTFECSSGALVITDFFPGSYQVVLTGTGADGKPRYQGAAPVELATGENDIGTVTLGYVRGDVTFFWSFGGVQDCVAAGVANVQIVVLDSLDVVEFNEIVPCSDRGATITDFVRGDYTLVLYGLDVGSQRLYEAHVALPINVGENEYGVIDLSPSIETGMLTFSWSFDGGLGCAGAAVARVAIFLYAPGGALVFSDTPVCDVGAYTVSNLDPGSYDLQLRGQDSDGTTRFNAGPLRVEVGLGNNDLGNFDLNKL